MTRTVKDPDVRRGEILIAAGELFRTQGYLDTSVEAIIRKAGIAKGTFYYYFQSKEEVLASIVHEMVNGMVEASQTVAQDASLNALEKIRLILREQSRISDSGHDFVEDLHRPENREFHEKSNVETVLVFAPIMARVVEQGVKEGIWNTEKPLETVQFILAGSQFLLDTNLFHWDPQELLKRTQAMQMIIERALAAPEGSFGFLTERYFKA